jgi:neutral ceramidase
MSTSSFCAGAAQVKTTPPLGTRINGDFITHYANFVHDDLFAKALVLHSGGITVAMVVVDICIMPKDFLDATKVEIERVTGIPFSNILISSTHTHAAGSVADVHLGSIDPAYAKKLPGLIVSAVQQAVGKLRPAKIGFGLVSAPEHLLCRRYEMAEGYIPFNPVTGEPDRIKTNPFGVEADIVRGIAPTDPGLNYLAVKDLEGQWIGLLANYSLHYVGDWENGTISADYFGVFAAQLTEKLQASGGGFVCMMSNGTSGDVNIWDFKDSERYPKAHFEKSKLIGTDLADKVFQDLPDISWQENPPLSVLYHETEVDVVKPSPEELLSARQIVSAARYEDIVVDQDGLRQLYAREQLLLNEFPDKGLCPVQAIRVGDGVIGALAGEFFSETGLYLKENVTPGPYFTISMANGNVGYVPPAAEIAKGGYETWRCRYSCLVPGAEQIIREKLLSLVKQLTVDM